MAGNLGDIYNPMALTPDRRALLNGAAVGAAKLAAPTRPTNII